MPTPGFRPAVRRILHDFEPIGLARREQKKSLLFNTLRANMISSRPGVARGPSFTAYPLEEAGFETLGTA
jgi:hypothetical protein